METTDNLPVKKIETVSEIIKRNIGSLERGSEIAITNLKAVQELVIENDEQRQDAINAMVKIRGVAEKVKELRMQATAPMDELKSFLMSFERPIDPDGKDNEFAKAKKVITDYDQRKLDEKKKAEAEAEVMRQVNVYKAEIKAAVGRMLAETIAGQKKDAIAKLAIWESKITLEKYDAAVDKIHNATKVELNKERYDACFHTNFNKKHLLNEELTKEYIESLKLEYPYDKFNSDYQAIMAEIINEYRAKMPSIKLKLEEAKDNAEKAAARQKEIEEQARIQIEEVDKQSSAAIQSIENTKDMETIQAEFIKQGSTQDLDAGPSKKKASFENDALWLVALQSAIGHVAATGINIKKRNGEYIDAIQFWLTKFEALGKEVKGIKLEDVAKTIVRAKE